MKRLRGAIFVILIMVLCIALIACNNATPQASGSASESASATTQASATTEASASSEGQPIKIGVSFGTYQEERWHREYAFMQKRCEELGIEITYQDANHDSNLQNQQIENFITQGMDALIISPNDSQAAAVGVEHAAAAGVKTIAYVRSIESDKTNTVVGTNYVEVGKQLANACLEAHPTGKYVLLCGDPNSPPAIDMHTGALSILQPYIDKGDIQVVFDQYIPNWSSDNALAAIENVLTKEDNDIDVILSQNDAMAGGADRALAAQNLQGKVYLTGTDADLDALQRLVEGRQSIDFLPESQAIAYAAIDAAVALCKNDGSFEKLVNAQTKLTTVDVEIPTILTPEIPITKDNILDTIVTPGIATIEDIYKNLPKDQWPATS